MFLKHVLEVYNEEGQAKEISIINFPEDVASIRISDGDLKSGTAYINLNKEELHNFIGVLLHVQSKMKGGKNG